MRPMIHYASRTVPYLLAAAMAIATASGCASHKKPPEKTAKKDKPKNEFFQPDSESRDIDYYIAAQSENGARANGTLLGAHFDGARLNALGREQLDFMSHDRAEGPMTVYLDLPRAEADLTKARQQQVSAYLKDSGLASADFLVKDGANPRSATPAAPLMFRMYRAESASAAAPGVAPAQNSYNPEKK